MNVYAVTAMDAWGDERIVVAVYAKESAAKKRAKDDSEQCDEARVERVIFYE